MKKLVFIAVFVACVGAVNTSAQCVETAADPCVSIHQSLLDRSVKAANELVAAREYIAKLEKAGATSGNALAAADAAIGALQKALATGDEIQRQYRELVDTYKAVIAIEQSLNDQLLKQLNKPRSTWQKLVATIGKVVVLLAGVAIGHGL